MSKDMKFNNISLQHHGVLGMKWGIRRYQPYGEGGYMPKKKHTNMTEEQEKTYNVLKKKQTINTVASTAAAGAVMGITTAKGITSPVSIPLNMTYALAISAGKHYFERQKVKKEFVARNLNRSQIETGKDYTSKVMKKYRVN